jgi:hypothetical protein
MSFLRRVSRSPMLPIGIFVTAAMLAVTSSRDRAGSAFFAPIVPPLLPVAVWGLLAVSSHRYYKRTVAFLLVVIATMGCAPFIDLRTILAPPWVANVPVLGGVTVTDGRGTLQDYGAAGGFGPAGGAEPISSTMGKAWISLDKQTAATITRMHGANAVIAFGFRHGLYNVNTVNLQQILSTGVRFGALQIEPVVTGDSIQWYLSWLTGEATTACVLLTSDRARGDFAPSVNPVYMREAAERAGSCHLASG